MGGSRRRLKKGKSKVRVGGAINKRKKTEKSRVPLEVSNTHTDVADKLNISVDWEKERNLTDNYRASGLAADPNQRFGRNSSALPLKSREEREAAGEECFDDDDELRAGCNLPRHTGPAPPPRLTDKQRRVITALVEAHGDDLQAMVLDTKRNTMQHSAGQLKKLREAARYWSGDPSERHDFRAPRKKPKKLF